LSDYSDTRISDVLRRALEGVLTRNQRIINDLETVQTVAGWLREAKHNNKKIPSIILNEAIKWLLNNLVPRLSMFLVDSIKIETGDNFKKKSIKQIEVSFGLKPYIDYVMRVNGVATKKARITFSINLVGKLENIQISSNIGRRYITIERFIASLTISIIKIGVFVPPNETIDPLLKPIQLCNNQYFKLENLSFHP
jgi:hypothetical protein